MPYTPAPMAAVGRIKNGATTLYSLPGVTFYANWGSTIALGANNIYYLPIYTTTQTTVDQLAAEITIAAAAGKLLRLGLYNADIDWNVSTLVVDGGAVAADATGVKTFSVSVVLPPGRYLIAVTGDGAPTVRQLGRGTIQNIGIQAALGSTPAISLMQVAKTYAALSDPGTTWSTINADSGQQYYFACIRQSVP
jgi:hypothetical protein